MKSGFLATVVITAVGFTQAAQGDTFTLDSYTFTTLPFLADAVNNAGEVVGPSFNGPGGFLYANGVFTPINGFTPTAINNLGQIAGTTQTQIVLDNSGILTTINVPGATPLAPVSVLAINDLGQMVGLIGGQSFLYSNGVFSSISVPTSYYTEVLGINDAGEIVGQYDPVGSTGIYGFLYDDGVFTTTFEGVARSINNEGQILNSTGYSAFIETDGGFASLPAEVGNEIYQYTGLNDAGQLTGWITILSPSGASGEGFLATPTPTPEPVSFALFGIGLLVLARFHKRQPPAHS